MSLVHVALLGIGPAALVGLTGILVRSRLKAHKPTLLWPAFLFSALAVLFIALILTTSLGHRPDDYALLLVPAIVGTLTALFVHLVSHHNLRTPGMGKMVPLAIATTMLFVVAWAAYPSVMSFVVLASAVAALTWCLLKLAGKRLIIASVLGFFWLFLASTIVFSGFEPALADTPVWLQVAYGLPLLISPAIVVVVAGCLLHAGLGGGNPVSWWAAVLYLGLMALLLLAVSYLIVAESIWDGAEDGLAGIMIATMTSLVGIGVALLLAWAFAGWRRLAALGFAILVPVLTFSAFGLGWQISHLDLTEQRAETLDRAIQRYYDQNERFPGSLTDLTPRYSLYVPNPMIMRGQTWCYDGGRDYYRLGYVYQPGFGAPAQEINIRIHRAQGEVPEVGWPCDDRLEKARSNTPWQ